MSTLRILKLGHRHEFHLCDENLSEQMQKRERERDRERKSHEDYEEKWC